MPEGHTIHRLARRHRSLLRGHAVTASSPQGRFEDGAAVIDGAVLLGTDAWGKHLFHDYGDHVLHVHLGLYGKFRDGSGTPPEPRGALRLRLVGGGHWLDLRGPTACELLTAPEVESRTARLGPDPLRRGADVDRFLDRVGRSRAPAGTLLLDQSVIAGVGNVYRAEVLLRAGISPWTAGRDVARPFWQAVWEDLVVLLRAGVRAGRIVTTEPEDRGRPAGRVRRIDAHYVYGRAGLPCRRCGTPVQRGELAARSIFWCPVCQPAD
ncbi:DNA-formamidopyrimidine glycosylase family protein [Nocardioides sp. REDSEA-S30_B4]|uniref:Fpg/Nei family DNA glycosylase n=1 Tax=Nocardioides sp. REDSEA-S30_B4 TaxID=1811552 RepID=UPI000A601259|nr:DNA-formamidopyrimidine glycosylase family protein [Nocardioides sp. REDSEA-S30_B4]